MTICPQCSYPHETPACPNPACLANPSLTEAHKAKLVANREAYVEQEREREQRLKGWAQAFARRY